MSTPGTAVTKNKPLVRFRVSLLVPLIRLRLLETVLVVEILLLKVLLRKLSRLLRIARLLWLLKVDSLLIALLKAARRLHLVERRLWLVVHGVVVALDGEERPGIFEIGEKTETIVLHAWRRRTVTVKPRQTISFFNLPLFCFCTTREDYQSYSPLFILPWPRPVLLVPPVHRLRHPLSLLLCRPIRFHIPQLPISHHLVPHRLWLKADSCPPPPLPT